MQNLKYYITMLSLLVNMIAGCGGGGGATAGPAVSDTTAPNITAFTLPATSTSLTVAISNFAAADAVGVTGYLVTESSSPPAAADAGWSATTPASFTFQVAGTMTAYAWARDAAGNVSSSSAASVTIAQQTTKTAILKLFSTSTNPGDVIGGFELSVILPAGSVIPTDADGITPLPGVVFLSGKFAGATSLPLNSSYDSTLRKLTANYGSSDNNQLGEFITILLTVPVSYVPNTSDIDITFSAFTPFTGNLMPAVSSIALFN